MKDKFISIYKELFYEVVTKNNLSIQENESFNKKEGFANLGVIVYNILRGIYEKNMEIYGRPLPSVNIKLNQKQTKAFLNKILAFSLRYNNSFIELNDDMKKTMELINKKSTSHRLINGKPISEKPAEVLPWSKVIERKVISSKVYEKSCPNMIGRRFKTINGKESYENIMEIVKIRV